MIVSVTSSVGLHSEDLDLPCTAAREEHAVRRRALQHRLCECSGGVCLSGMWCVLIQPFYHVFLPGILEPRFVLKPA
jgi:hypothetical protein